jgi:hypothetical protein
MRSRRSERRQCPVPEIRGALWLFFRVARSTVWQKYGRFHRQSGSDRALKNSQLTSDKVPRISGTGH